MELHPPSIPNFPKDIDTRYRPSIIAVDTECTGLNWSTGDRPFGVSMAWRDEKGKLKTAWWDWPVDPKTRQPQYQGSKGFNLFSSYYCDPTIPKVGANLKFDRHMLRSAKGIEAAGTCNDVLIAAWCCFTMEPSYKLNDLAEKYLGIHQQETVKLKETVKSLQNKYRSSGNVNLGTWGQDYWLPKFHFPLDRTCEIYGRKDAARTLLLWEYYSEGLQVLENQAAYWREIQVAEVIYRMERIGIRFNEDKCRKELVTLAEKMDQIKFDLFLATNDAEFNLNSGKQIAALLYDELGCPVIKETKGGRPSTDFRTLKKLLSCGVSPKAAYIIEKLLEYSGLSTGESYCYNYLSNLTEDESINCSSVYDFNTNPKCVHANFNQIAADNFAVNNSRTGRLTSSNPNLQNVADPSKSVGSTYVCDSRGFFIPRADRVFYCIDYSQLELRIFAERCGGPLKQAFLEGRDPHDETRRNVPCLAAMENKEKARKLAKHTNFTIANCGGATALEEKYDIPYLEGIQIVSDLNEAMPQIRKRQKEAERFAIKHGYIETIFGRKINVDRSRHSDGTYKYTYRATAYDIQGSAADIIKEAMIQVQTFIDEQKAERGLSADILLSIHDELVIEVSKSSSYKWFLKEIVYIMEHVADGIMEIPLKCEIVKARDSWSSKDKVEVKL